MAIGTSPAVEVSYREPIAAYDALAPYYHSLLETKKFYLQAIEEIVVSHAGGARSLLDMGSGNGVRALRIAKQANIENVFLVEPSEGMRSQSPDNAAVWKRSLSEIPPTARFDLITCLWNVLGHVDGTEERVSTLSTLKTLLSSSGTLFLDVNHRYNAAAYGWPRTIARLAHDFLFPSEKNGDVVASWQAGNQRIATRGHVFTHAEFLRLAHRAGLKLKGRWFIDYHTGIQHKSSFLGNLLYQLTA